MQPVVNLRDKQSLAAANVTKKIDLKTAAEVFGLWDTVYGKDAIRSLENSIKWDPSKKMGGEKDKKPAKRVKNQTAVDRDLTRKVLMRKSPDGKSP